jgi:hypothetical protein
MKRNGKRHKILYFKVIMSDRKGAAEGKPYRIIAAPGSLSLYNFAEVIVGSFDFEFGHPFGFYDNTEQWKESTRHWEQSTLRFDSIGDGGSRFESVRETKIEDVFLETGKEMLFLMRYTDESHFLLRLVKIEEYPCIIERVD